MPQYASVHLLSQLAFGAVKRAASGRKAAAKAEAGLAFLPRRQPRQQRSRLMVQRLLDAAARVFLEQGFAVATTNRVAEEAGVSVGSLYRFFPHKAALMGELQARWTGRLGAELDEVLRGPVLGGPAPGPQAPSDPGRLLPLLIDAVLDVHTRLHAESGGLLGLLMLHAPDGREAGGVRRAVQERLERLDALWRPGQSAEQYRLRALMIIHIADALYTLDPSGALNPERQAQVRSEVRLALLRYLTTAGAGGLARPSRVPDELF